MALADRWMLPDGVKEMLPPDARRVEELRRSVLDLYASWGYDLVMPPLVEHLDSLLTGVGKDLALNTFQLVDQLTGRTLGIRADITPQVARIDAHSMQRDGTNRLCYSGTVLHTHQANMLASRDPLQIGAELYGHAGLESDLEIISLMLETLHIAGVDQALSLDLTHVGIFQAVADSAGFNRLQMAQYMDLLQRKALPELDEFLQTIDLVPAVADQLARLPRLCGGREVLAAARELFADKADILPLVDYLSTLAGRITERYPEVDLYFDLSELRGYKYHTGVVFAALSPEFGQPIAKGGRYDEIGKDFGRARPATGFSADLKILAGLSSMVHEAAPLIVAPAGQEVALLECIGQLRAQGERVVQLLPEEENMPADCRRLVKQGESWVLETAAS